MCRRTETTTAVAAAAAAAATTKKKFVKALKHQHSIHFISKLSKNDTQQYNALPLC
jgi:hypothetical protein